jgi:hypothetical protein
MVKKVWGKDSNREISQLPLAYARTRGNPYG